MKTVQTTLDEPLVQQIDEAAQALGTTRSGFVRDAVTLALRQYRIWRERSEGSAGMPSEAGNESRRIAWEEATEEVLREHAAAWEKLACL